MASMSIMTASAAALLAASPAAAQEQGSRQTREYLQQASQSDTFEIMESRTALAQSGDPQVRAFAEQMIRDHTRTSATLQQAAMRAGLTPPPMTLGEDQARMLNDLQSQRGHMFDEVYARHQALAHRSALVVHQGYVAGGDKAELRQTAGTTSNLVASHLGMADQLRAHVGG